MIRCECGRKCYYCEDKDDRIHNQHKRIEVLEADLKIKNALIDRAILWADVHPDDVHDVHFDDIIEDMRKSREE